MFYIGLKGLPHRRKSVAVHRLDRALAVVQGLATASLLAGVAELAGDRVVVVLGAHVRVRMRADGNREVVVLEFDGLDDLKLLICGEVLDDGVLVEHRRDRHHTVQVLRVELALLREVDAMLRLLKLGEIDLVHVEPLGHGAGDSKSEHGVESEIEEERRLYTAILSILDHQGAPYDSIPFDSKKPAAKKNKNVKTKM